MDTKIGEVENEIPDTRSSVTTTVLNTKFNEAENKLPDHVKYITSSEFKKLTAEIFTARLKQVDLVNKTDFDDKLTSFNRKIT